MPHHSFSHLVAYSTPPTGTKNHPIPEEILLEGLEGGHDWFNDCFGCHGDECQ